MNLALPSKHASLLVPLALLGAFFAGAYLLEYTDSSVPIHLAKHASEIIALCASESYPPACYDIEIPKLMDRGITFEEAFAVTSLIQARQHDYFYCHVLGHNLSAKETAKDTSKWTDVVSRCPTGMCSNGCLHGAAQERFRAEALTASQIDALIPELAAICESGEGRTYTGLEQASCYHSLGHLSMYISGANVDIATGVCDQVVVKKEDTDYTQTCYDGVFMQIFQPLEPEDFALVEHIPAKTALEAETFCEQYSGKRRSACHNESWPRYLDLVKTPEGLAKFCARVPDTESEQRCYTSMFYVLAAQFHLDANRMESLCIGLREKRMAQCFANSASRLIETDYRLIEDAVALCERATRHGVEGRCYDELLYYSSFNFHEGSDEFLKLCQALPEPWHEKCLRGEGGSVILSADDY